MTVGSLYGTWPGHSHWCPHCETTWACTHNMPTCPTGGGIVVDSHCAQESALDLLD